MSAEPLTAPVADPEARLRELATQYPEPSLADWIADRLWLNEQLEQGAFDAHYGKVLAVYNKELVAVGDDYYQMLLTLSPKLQVHPERIVGLYLGE